VVSITPSGVEVYLHVEGVMDVEAEMERLAGRISKAEQERARISSKLENEQFVSKAPPDVVRRERDRLGGDGCIHRGHVRPEGCHLAAEGPEAHLSLSDASSGDAHKTRP